MTDIGGGGISPEDLPYLHKSQPSPSRLEGVAFLVPPNGFGRRINSHPIEYFSGKEEIWLWNETTIRLANG